MLALLCFDLPECVPHFGLALGVGDLHLQVLLDLLGLALDGGADAVELLGGAGVTGVGVAAQVGERGDAADHDQQGEKEIEGIGG
ncbi:hypothetical protein BOW53_02910 [Solemya pervernicosa gill symbiont]|uniref:Uncharacterized protein n=1 Tax=Solemya pervernicosa gill symbiont TaxID=642797 RepID=A0A1T2L962_9GAMM|nr:hypothetical protein BOW53_02910 [Solemya pervernicosa gill symbiont]